MSEKVLYRAVFNEYNDLNYLEFEVLSKTLEGWWISVDGKKKWTNGKWASPNKESALNHLRHRTRSYTKHCLRRLEDALIRLKKLGLDLPDHTQRMIGGSELVRGAKVMASYKTPDLVEIAF